MAARIIPGGGEDASAQPHKSHMARRHEQDGALVNCRDPEAQGEGDMDEDSDDGATVECPHCGAEVYEGAQRCPACGRYLSEEDTPSPRRSLWFLIGLALCLIAVLMFALF